MSTTTMTPTPSDIALPLCQDTAFKQEMLERIKLHIEDEVRDYINCQDHVLEGEAYNDELSAILSYLDENLLIYLK